MSLAFFPLYVDDYEADTAHLTILEDGAYSRLLRLCWRTPGCKIPADEKWIMRKMRARTEDEKRAVCAVLEEFFIKRDSKYSNPRLSSVYADAAESHQRRKTAGSAGGNAKARKIKENLSGNAKAMLKQLEPEPEPYVVSAKAATTSQAQEDQALPDADSWNPDRLHTAVCWALGLRDRLPTYWLPPSAPMHVWKWHSELGLSPQSIVDAARKSRANHPEPPRGPKALDGVMKRLSETSSLNFSAEKPDADRRERWKRMASK